MTRYEDNNIINGLIAEATVMTAFIKYSPRRP